MDVVGQQGGERDPRRGGEVLGLLGHFAGIEGPVGIAGGRGQAAAGIIAGGRDQRHPAALMKGLGPCVARGIIDVRDEFPAGLRLAHHQQLPVAGHHFALVLPQRQGLQHVARFPVVVGQLASIREPDVFARTQQGQGTLQIRPRHFLQFLLAFAVHRALLGLAHAGGEVVHVLLGHQLMRPDLLFGFEIIPGQGATVEKHQLIGVHMHALAGLGALVKGLGENRMRQRGVKIIPDGRGQKQKEDGPNHGRDQARLAPKPGFHVRGEAGIDGHVDAVGLGLAFAEGRAEISEQFHALRADGLVANGALFGRRLLVPGANAQGGGSGRGVGGLPDGNGGAGLGFPGNFQAGHAGDNPGGRSRWW